MMGTAYESRAWIDTRTGLAHSSEQSRLCVSVGLDDASERLGCIVTEYPHWLAAQGFPGRLLRANLVEGGVAGSVALSVRGLGARLLVFGPPRLTAEASGGWELPILGGLLAQGCDAGAMVFSCAAVAAAAKGVAGTATPGVDEGILTLRTALVNYRPRLAAWERLRWLYLATQARVHDFAMRRFHNWAAAEIAAGGSTPVPSF